MAPVKRPPASGAGDRPPRRPKRDHDFARRVRIIIDKYDEGNVTAAARRIGVSQRGLAKIYAGETTSPRLDLVQAVIVAYPAEDPLWIVLGKPLDDEARIAAMAHQRAQLMLKTWLEGVSGMRT